VESAADLVDGRALAIVTQDIVSKAGEKAPAAADSSCGSRSSGATDRASGSTSGSNNRIRGGSDIHDAYRSDRIHYRNDRVKAVVANLVNHLGGWGNLNPVLQLWCQEIQGQLANDFADPSEAAMAILGALLGLRNSCSTSSQKLLGKDEVPLHSAPILTALEGGAEASLKDIAAKPTTVPSPALDAPNSSVYTSNGSATATARDSSANVSRNYSVKPGQATISTSGATSKTEGRSGSIAAATTSTMTDDSGYVPALGVHSSRNVNQSTCQRSSYGSNAIIPNVGNTGNSGALTSSRVTSSRGKGDGSGKGVVGNRNALASQNRNPTRRATVQAPFRFKRPPPLPSPPPSPRLALDYPGIDVENQEPSLDRSNHNRKGTRNEAKISGSSSIKNIDSTSHAHTNGIVRTKGTASDAAYGHACDDRGQGLRMSTMWDPTYRPSAAHADRSVQKPTNCKSADTAQANLTAATWDSSSSITTRGNNRYDSSSYCKDSAARPLQTTSSQPIKTATVGIPRNSSASTHAPSLSMKKQVPDSSSSSSRRVSFAQNGATPPTPPAHTQEPVPPSSVASPADRTPRPAPLHTHPRLGAAATPTPSAPALATTPAQRAAAAANSAIDSGPHGTSKRPQSNTEHRESHGIARTGGKGVEVSTTMGDFVSKEVNAARSERAAKRAARRQRLQTFVNDQLRAIQVSGLREIVVTKHSCFRLIESDKSNFHVVDSFPVPMLACAVRLSVCLSIVH